jgi:very-short-patch-repair endonuclease
VPGTWTAQEEERLIALYPVAPRSDVLGALPGRSWKAVGIRASKLGLGRCTEAAYDHETKRRMREAALQKYREHPELREHLSARTKALYRAGVLKSPLAAMGNGQAPPPYEILAWTLLEPLGFQRQYCVVSGKAGPPYKLDFGHPELKLDIEIEGRQHAETRIQERDRERDAHLTGLGWRVVRIRNEAIRTALLEILARRLPE